MFVQSETGSPKTTIGRDRGGAIMRAVREDRLGSGRIGPEKAAR